MTIVQIVHDLDSQHHQGVLLYLDSWPINTQVKFVAAANYVSQNLVDRVAILARPIRDVASELCEILPKKRSRSWFRKVVCRVTKQS